MRERERERERREIQRKKNCFFFLLSNPQPFPSLSTTTTTTTLSPQKGPRPHHRQGPRQHPQDRQAQVRQARLPRLLRAVARGAAVDLRPHLRGLRLRRAGLRSDRYALLAGRGAPVYATGRARRGRPRGASPRQSAVQGPVPGREGGGRPLPPGRVAQVGGGRQPWRICPRGQEAGAAAEVRLEEGERERAEKTSVFVFSPSFQGKKKKLTFFPPTLFSLLKKQQQQNPSQLRPQGLPRHQLPLGLHRRRHALPPRRRRQPCDRLPALARPLRRRRHGLRQAGLLQGGEAAARGRPGDRPAEEHRLGDAYGADRGGGPAVGEREREQGRSRRKRRRQGLCSGGGRVDENVVASFFLFFFFRRLLVRLRSFDFDHAPFGADGVSTGPREGLPGRVRFFFLRERERRKKRESEREDQPTKKQSSLFCFTSPFFFFNPYRSKQSFFNRTYLDLHRRLGISSGAEVGFFFRGREFR